MDTTYLRRKDGVKMGTLYELTNDFEYLKNLLESGEIDEQLFNDTIAGIECEIEAKADGYAKIRQSLKADVNALKDEEARLCERRAALERNVSKLEKALESAMIQTGKEKFKTTLFSFSIANNPASVEITNEQEVPPEFLIQQPARIDKAKIKEALKDTGSLPFARLKQTRGLRIR